MSQEDKKLLFKDLSARLHYELIVSPSDCGNARLVGCLLDSVLIQDIRTGEDYDKPWDIEYVRPYLRPMSSMTEEEKRELFEIGCEGNIEYPYGIYFRCQDWLLSHRFDFRNLIERGLAIAVTEENNPYKD